MAEETSKEVTAAPVPDGLFRFISEVRRERRSDMAVVEETYLTTILVFIMVAISMVFFAVVDTCSAMA
jgi:preprotein translocase subunit SecE